MTKKRGQSLFCDIFFKYYVSNSRGADALGIRLVDEIGTLEDAVLYAASLAGNPDISGWNVCGYPLPQSPMEKALSMIGKGGSDGRDILLGTLRDLSSPQVLARMDRKIEVK